MNYHRKLTGNPDKASRITAIPKPTRLDTEAGDQFTRTMPRVGDLDEESRTLRAVVATATPVKRQDAKGPFLEILDPRGLQLDGDDDVPLLIDHKQAARETVGRASGITIDGPSVSATLRLGMADDIEPIFQRVKDGTVRHVSAGYQVLAWRESRNPDGTRIKTAAKWRLLEVSLVPVPADRNAIIHRSAEMPFDLETRAALVEKLRHQFKLPDAWGDNLTDETVTEDECWEAAREALLARQAPRIRVRQDHTDPAQIQTRAADALAYRMGCGDLPEASREFIGMSLMDHAKDSLQRAGVSTRGMSADDVLSRSMHTTSDFLQTVSGAANKVAADGYQNAETPLKRVFRQRSLSDFKTSTSIRLGGMGQLQEMTEAGEFTATSRGEEGETLQLRTFGRRLDLSRRLIINDDLGLFGDTTRALGEAAAATEAQLMADLLLGGDKLSDGKALFHASRGNIAESPTSDPISGLSGARLVLRKQTNLDGVTPISATPRYVIAGPEMETALEKALGVITPPDAESYNPFASRLLLLIEPRITDDSWFVVADPSQCAVFNLAHLAAAPGPQIQRQEAWDTLGVSFRCWMDVGAGFAGWRGIVKMSNR